MVDSNKWLCPDVNAASVTASPERLGIWEQTCSWAADGQWHRLSGSKPQSGDRSVLWERERDGVRTGDRGKRSGEKTQLVLLKGGSKRISKLKWKWLTLSRGSHRTIRPKALKEKRSLIREMLRNLQIRVWLLKY